MGNKLCSCETDFPHNENTDANLTVNYNKIQFELPKTRKGNRKEMMLVESLTDNDNEHYTIPSTNRKNYEPIRKFLRKMLIRYMKMQMLSHIKKKEKREVQSIYDKLNQLNTEAKYNTQKKDIETLPKKIVYEQKKSSVDTIKRKEIEELKKGLVGNNKSNPLSSAINNTYKKKETKYSIISNITTSSNIHEEEQVKPKGPPPIKKSYIFKNKKKIIPTSNSKRNTAIFEPNKFGNLTKAPTFGVMSNVPQKEDNYNKKTTIEESSEGNDMNNNSSSIQESSNHNSDNLSYNEYD